MAVASIYRSAHLLNAALLLSIVALTAPCASALTFYVPREKSPDQSFANMELEKAVKEMLTKMDDTEVDNIKNYCEISSEKVPIPSTQRSLIVMCQVLGYKPLIVQAKPKRSISQYLQRSSNWLRPSRY